MIPLVLLHFFGSSRREWADVSSRMPADATILAIDLPGFGDAAGEPPRDASGMADVVEARIAAAGFEACVVVGHSMSGKVAALLAARRATWLKGIVLVTASPPSPEPMTAEARCALLAFDGSRGAAEHYVDGLTAARLPVAPRECAIGDVMRASPVAWRAWIEHGSQEDCAATVGLVALPALVVAGASDPSLGIDIQRALVMPHFPQASLVTIAGGHALPLESAPDLARAIARFVEQLASHPQPA
jgi:pimeloyl-ACP methyl ester carboxylesterase